MAPSQAPELEIKLTEADYAMLALMKRWWFCFFVLPPIGGGVSITVPYLAAWICRWLG